MKKLIVGMAFMIFMIFSASASAVPYLSPAIFGLLGGGMAYQAGQHDLKVGSCYNEPIRLVKWKDAPGYSFEVAGCDYQAKKDKLVVVK